MWLNHCQRHKVRDQLAAPCRGGQGKGRGRGPWESLPSISTVSDLSLPSWQDPELYPHEAPYLGTAESPQPWFSLSYRQKRVRKENVEIRHASACRHGTAVRKKLLFAGSSSLGLITVSQGCALCHHFSPHSHKGVCRLESHGKVKGQRSQRIVVLSSGLVMSPHDFTC